MSHLRASYLAVCLATAVVISPVVAQSAPPAAIDFEATPLGISRADWRTRPPPGAVSSNTKPACSDDPGGVGLTPTAAERKAHMVICAYVDAYGGRALPVAFAIDKASKLDHLRYGFVGDRLVQIRAEASLDAYDALVGELTHRYGAPGATVRDTVKSEIGALPRVILTWTTPTGSIRLRDPVLPRDKISLEFGAKAG
jgi:hypothetical protein